MEKANSEHNFAELILNILFGHILVKADNS
jgi:hypothetical protein